MQQLGQSSSLEIRHSPRLEHPPLFDGAERAGTRLFRLKSLSSSPNAGSSTFEAGKGLKTWGSNAQPFPLAGRWSPSVQAG